MRLKILMLLVGAAVLMPAPRVAAEQAVELGTIDWLRDYETALVRAAETNRPVLILFQEVPGCATCRNYGLRVLSHPLLAEAAEELFVPLAIFNNRPGEDAAVLRLFEEPSWNNPVVRIVDASQRELTRRLAGDYTPGGFSGAMITALKKSGKPVPDYLDTLHQELSARGSEEKARLSMFCFWQGEIDLGGLDGVLSTRAGFVDGSEVVEITFDTRRLSYSELLRQAKKLKCADRTFPLSPEQRKSAEKILGRQRVGTLTAFRPDSGTKYYLARTPLRFVPMTAYQQVQVNRAVYQNQDTERFLSPRQREMLSFIRRHPATLWDDLRLEDDLRGAWKIVWHRMKK